MADETARTEWNAQAYHRLSRPQQEWGEAVLHSLALEGNETVVDVGCGSGLLTRKIAARVPRGRVVAVDRSANMLRAARADWPGERFPAPLFVLADAAALPLAGAADVVFSTATFHWVPDHDALFRSLFAALRPRGRLIAQCGGGPNLERLHARASRLMAGPVFAPWFRDWTEPWRFERAGPTADRLAAAGFDEIETSLTPAPTRLPDRQGYMEFLETVIVRPHLLRLPDQALRRRFLEALAGDAATDAPAYSLDYWRLNMRARRPA